MQLQPVGRETFAADAGGKGVTGNAVAQAIELINVDGKAADGNAWFIDVAYPGARGLSADQMAERIFTPDVAVAEFLLAIDLENDMAQIVGHEIGFE